MVNVFKLNRFLAGYVKRSLTHVSFQTGGKYGVIFPDACLSSLK